MYVHVCTCTLNCNAQSISHCIIIHTCMQMADMIVLKHIHAAGTGTMENKEGSICDNLIVHTNMNYALTGT